MIEKLRQERLSDKNKEAEPRATPISQKNIKEDIVQTKSPTVVEMQEKFAKLMTS